VTDVTRAGYGGTQDGATAGGAPAVGTTRLGAGVAVLSALGVLALFGYGLAAGGAAGPGGRVNATRATVDMRLRPAAPFTLRLFGGGSLDLAGASTPPTLLNFWASWCEPCRSEAPALETLDARFRGRGVRVVGLNVWDEAATAQRFLRELGIDYPNGPDVGAVAVEYGVRGVPETYLIDGRGRLVRRWIGPVDADDVGGTVETLLADS
jgi:cytochrome c biogenesis protein CcmG/thiol:disulfide interchange protein DsbE